MGGNPMTRIEVLKTEIERLSPEELAEFRDWFLQYDWQAWDRQIEADAASSKLLNVLGGSLEDHKAGKCREV